MKNFYVDDCLKSVDAEDEAIALTKGLRGVCKAGGFRLTKWPSNNRNVNESIPQEERAKGLKEINLDTDHLPISLILNLNFLLCLPRHPQYIFEETECFRKINSIHTE